MHLEMEQRAHSTVGLEVHHAEVADAVNAIGWAAELADADWRLIWISREMRRLLRDPEGIDLGIGMHVLEARLQTPMRDAVDEGSRIQWLRENLPRLAAWSPAGLDGLRALLPQAVNEEVGPLAPVGRKLLWTGDIEYVEEGLPPATTHYLTVSLGEPPRGWLTVYGPSAPATVVSLITRGNLGHFQRMAELQAPARHETAVLFADIQASGTLARHLSTAAWFDVVRDFSTQVDAMVIEAGGVVGRHAGDGVVAFFLADQLGSRGAACSAALRAARRMVTWRPEEFAMPEELHINAGVHWGGALYLGQIVTGGRLEVTALGDEVNECARIQETARDGTLLASKNVVERLDPGEAEALGLDPRTTTYRCIAELPGATEKALRDAGQLPVVAVPVQR